MRFNSNKHDYILIVIILALTGFMSFFGQYSWIYFVAPYILILFHFRNCHFSKQSIIVLLVSAVLFIYQCVVHHGAPILAITLFFRFLFMAMCAIIIAPRFYKTFPNVMFVICIVSLFFYLITSFSPILRSFCIDIAQLLPEFRSDEFLSNNTNDSYSLYIYTIPKNQTGISRNSGPFWEPGLFTVFITLAFAISLFNDRRFLTTRNLVLLVTNITTFSTTGYVATAILIVGYVLVSKTPLWQKTLIVIVLLLLSPFVYSLDFMREKITTQMMQTDVAWSRFGAVFYHWEKIRLSPYIGYGINELPATDMDEALVGTMVSPNGISYVAVLFGIPLAFVYFYYVYRSTRIMLDNPTKLNQFIILLVILALVFSQDVTGRLFFFMILFMGVESFSIKPICEEIKYKK